MAHSPHLAAFLRRAAAFLVPPPEPEADTAPAPAPAPASAPATRTPEARNDA
jgi:hypothetical protein